ncbi:ash family protein [Serratia marcescens]|nr:ash family protein [Serratia marcescens]
MSVILLAFQTMVGWMGQPSGWPVSCNAGIPTPI